MTNFFPRVLLTALFLPLLLEISSAQNSKAKAYEQVRNDIDKERLAALQARLDEQQLRDSIQIEAYKKRYGQEAVYRELEDGTIIELVGFEEDGSPIFYQTDNRNAALTANTTAVQIGGSSSYNLSGDDVIVGIWDGGLVRATHQEFGNRIVLQETGGHSSHGTHVGGTIAAAGQNPAAKGMAPEATLWSWDFGGDSPEMTGFAAQGNILSNHSYGTVAGWRLSNGDWYWYGDTLLSTTEDRNYGRYDSKARTWDELVVANPYYLIAKSAGNNRNSIGPAANNPEHFIRDPQTGGWIRSSAIRPRDCPTGYDCITTYSNAKNILTVAAVEATTDYQGPADVRMSTFSSWGPTDDGRIKPEISAQGVSLFSSDNGSNSDYGTKSGTSMSTPSVTGSIALIQELNERLSGSFLKAATIKALLVETAKPTGGGVEPDYSYGFGLIDTKAACDVVARSNPLDTIIEASLSQGAVFSLQMQSTGTSPLSATLAWTDPAGPANWPVVLNDTNSVLINDLDMLLIAPDGTTIHYPFVLDPANPSAPATRGDNRRDNIEKVFIQNPVAGTYTLEIRHKGNLQNGSQEFSLVTSKGNMDLCARPFAVEDLFVGIDTASFTWNSPSLASNHQFRIRLNSGQSFLFPSTGGTARISNLSPGTRYEFSVRDICAVGDSSAWSAPFVFTTSCTVLSAPFQEDFNGSAWVSGTGANNSNDAIAPCWSRNPDTDANFFWGTRSGTTSSSTTGPSGDASPSGQGKYLFTEGTNGSFDDEARIYTPPINLGSLANPSLAFAYHLHGANIGELEIKVNAGLGWIKVGSIQGPIQRETSSPWLRDTISLAAYQGQTLRLGFFTKRGTNWRNDVALDDLAVISVVQHDLATTNVQAITAPCSQSLATIDVDITNFGQQAQSGFSVFLELSGAATGTYSQVFPGSLAGSSSATMRFSNISIHASGLLNMRAYTNLGNDQNSLNDSTETSLTIRDAAAEPNLPFSSLSTCPPNTNLVHIPLGSAGNVQFWYDANRVELGQGENFTIDPSILRDSVLIRRFAKFDENLGPPNNLIGTGGDFTSLAGQQLYFEVLSPLRIDSFTVYPNSAGTINVRIRNMGGATIANIPVTVNPNFPGQAQRIAIERELQPGSYQIDAANSTVTGLYRNNSGANYPYSSPSGDIRITGNSFQPAFYYFFYDWQVSTLACPSAFVPLLINDISPEVYLGNDTSYCQGDTWSLQLGGNIAASQYNWSTGETSPQIIVSGPGLYRLSVVDANGCQGNGELRVTRYTRPQPQLHINAPYVLHNFSPTVRLDAGNIGSTYLWSTGQTSRTIDVAEGFYRVTITSFFGCVNSDSAEVTRATSTQELETNSALRLFPNPTSGSCWLEWQGLRDESLRIRVLNTLGQVLYERELPSGFSQNSYALDIRELPPAMYFVELRTKTELIGIEKLHKQ